MKYTFTILLVFFCIAAQAKRHYVNANVVGGLKDGTSWANAFDELSLALDASWVAGDTFWVANGTYTSSTIEPWSFHIQPGCAVYGGFDGSETQLSQRNWQSFQTVLSGANAYGQAVVLCDQNGLLDGFKITHSAAPTQQRTHTGVIMYLNTTIANCQFTNLHNVSKVHAVNISSVAFSATINNCQFIDNGAYNTTIPANGGSSITCGGAQVTVHINDCLFKNNTAANGAGVFVRDGARVNINRCTFYGNVATGAGGAIYDSTGAKLRVMNSLFVGNKAAIGGAHYSTDSLSATHNFSHCTIAHNWSSTPSAQNYALWLRGAKDTLRNCILWGDSTGTGPELANPKAGAVFARNLIEGGASLFGATGTFTFPPMFAAPGTAAAAPFAASTAYNYHLSPFSNAIDTGASLALPAPFNLDRDGNPRAQGRFPDLGAYEWKACAWHNVSIAASGPTTFCLPDSVILTATGTPPYNHTYQWNGGAHTGRSLTVKAAGVHQVVIIDSLGCRASAAMTVNAVPAPSPTITQSGNKVSVPAIYATYQWYLNGSPISGATSATHTATSYGSYTVKVTTIAGACSGTSAPYSLLNLAVGGTVLQSSVHIYPNPTDGQLKIFYDGPAVRAASVTVRSVTGQQILIEALQPSAGGFSQTLDLGAAAKGVYFVELLVDGERLVKRVVVQ